MTAVGLTRMQADCLGFIASRIEEDGFSPSYDEIADHLDLASKSGVNRIVNGLVERGHLVRLPGRARALGLADGLSVKLPSDLSRTVRTEARRRGIAPADLVAIALSEWTGREAA